MRAKSKLILALAVVLSFPSLAVASPASPAAAPPAPSVGLEQPLVALSSGSAVCPAAAVPELAAAFQPLAGETCGACSDTACAGQMVHSVCGEGNRCIPGPACTSGPMPSCRCLPI